MYTYSQHTERRVYREKKNENCVHIRQNGLSLKTMMYDVYEDWIEIFWWLVFLLYNL